MLMDLEVFFNNIYLLMEQRRDRKCSAMLICVYITERYEHFIDACVVQFFILFFMDIHIFSWRCLYVVCHIHKFWDCDGTTWFFFYIYFLRDRCILMNNIANILYLYGRTKTEDPNITTLCYLCLQLNNFAVK